MLNIFLVQTFWKSYYARMRVKKRTHFTWYTLYSVNFTHQNRIGKNRIQRKYHKWLVISNTNKDRDNHHKHSNYLNRQMAQRDRLFRSASTFLCHTQCINAYDKSSRIFLTYCMLHARINDAKQENYQTKFDVRKRTVLIWFYF